MLMSKDITTYAHPHRHIISFFSTQQWHTSHAAPVHSILVEFSLSPLTLVCSLALEKALLWSIYKMLMLLRGGLGKVTLLKKVPIVIMFLGAATILIFQVSMEKTKLTSYGIIISVPIIQNFDFQAQAKVVFYFRRDVKSSHEYFIYSATSMLAEVGGYVGLLGLDSIDMI